jgi:hypothetical protein
VRSLPQEFQQNQLREESSLHALKIFSACRIAENVCSSAAGIVMIF